MIFPAGIGGRLLAEGTETARIRLTRAPGSVGNWGHLVVNGAVGSVETRIAYTDFEFNANNHRQRRALGNALAMLAIERMSDRVPVSCSANCLQPDGQNDNDWNQGLLFLNPSQVWLQPPGYVTRMISRAYQPWLAPVDVEPRNGELDVAAMRSQDGRTLVLQVVNAGEQEVAAVIRVDGFKPSKRAATVEELTGPLDARNTAESPARITPRSEQWRLASPDGPLRRVFPPRSFTVLIVGDNARSR